MSAPMGMRATAVRLCLWSNHKQLLSQRSSRIVSLSPSRRRQCQMWHRCLNSKSADNHEGLRTTNNNNDDITEGLEADDFFGIMENLRSETAETKATTIENSERTDEEGSVLLGQERVLEVKFGFIRRDSDNPALPRNPANREKYTLKESVLNSSRPVSESPDFMSRLLTHGHTRASNSTADSNERQVDLISKTVDFSPDSVLTQKGNLVDNRKHSNSIHLAHSAKPQSDSESDKSKTNFIDGQYFDARYLDNTEKNVGSSLCSVEYPETPEINAQLPDLSLKPDNAYHQQHEKTNGTDKDSMDFIDKQYFDTNTVDVGENLNSETSRNDTFHRNLSDFKAVVGREKMDSENLNFVDDQYFGTYELSDTDCLQNWSADMDSISRHEADDKLTISDSEISQLDVKSESHDSSTTQLPTHMTKEVQDGFKDKSPLYGKSAPPAATEDIIIDNITRQSQRLSKTVKPNLDQPQTAYDIAMKIRLENAGRISTVANKEKGLPNSASGKKVDSFGFRILKDQVPDWTYTQKEVLASVLRDSIIYDDNEIVAIDKPYGLASHGGPGVASSVGQLTPLLAQLLDRTGKLEKLHLIHRLDKETTGVMILARSPQMAWQLRELFRKRQVVKKYWLITKGVPNPAEGIIDIPMGESTRQKIHRMCLRPDHMDEAGVITRRSRLKSHKAVTQYRVLDRQSQCALVECLPVTGVKHQLRVHMAHGLNTPILGDHKYSHFSKLAPQKLYSEILHRLGIRQSKVRHLAMHLHARALVLPEFLDGRNLVLTARLPRHFLANMKRLKLSPSAK